MSTTLAQQYKDEEQIEDRKSVQLRLRPSIYAKARDLARREGIPIAKVVEEAIDDHCDK